MLELKKPNILCNQNLQSVAGIRKELVEAGGAT